MALFHVLTLFLLLCLTGCGNNDGVERASISGTVHFDGQPVESGVIIFIPEQGVVGPPVQIVIDQGIFKSSATSGPTVGENSVQILANRSSDKEVMVQGVKTTELLQYIPAKYNEQTTLKTVIQPGSNEVDYQLTP